MKTQTPAEARQIAQWLEKVLPHKMALRFVFDPADELRSSTARPFGWSLRGVTPQTEAMQLMAVVNNGYALQFAIAPSDAVIRQAIATSPGVLFDHRFDRKISTDVLEKMKPGLVQDIERMKSIVGEGEILRDFVKTALSERHFDQEPSALPALD